MFQGASCLFLLLVPILALRVNQGSLQCNEVPAHLEWGMVIDGKDADRGPSAYSSTKLGVDSFDMVGLLNTLRWVQGEGNSGPLTIEVVEQIHKWGWKDYRPFRWGKRFGKKLYIPGTDSLSCLAKLDDCVLVHRAVEGVDKDLVQAWRKNSTCVVGVKMVALRDSRSRLNQLLLDYNAALSGASSFAEKLTVLAGFLRNFAWVHPFHNQNGRMRTLLMQREVKRLGLGCGSFMYNNNRDVYFFNREKYEAKIREGLEMYKTAASNGNNPWALEAARQDHHNRFPVPEEMARKCTMAAHNGNIEKTKDAVKKEEQEENQHEELDDLDGDLF